MAFQFIQPISRVKTVKKSEKSQRALEELRNYLDCEIDEPIRFLGRFFEEQRDAISYSDLRTIIENEEIPKEVMKKWFENYAALVAEKITPLWKITMVAGYQSNPVFKDLPNFKFDTSEKLVREWLTERSAYLVTNCTENQREAIRYVISEAKYYQMSPAETAKYLRPVIGLTKPQEAANLRLYHSVKAQLREEHPRMRADTIERKARHAAARYAEKQHRYRAEMIARTEMATAYHQGNDAAVRQGIAQGLLPKMKKVWSTARDGKVCSMCLALEGMEVDLDSRFKGEQGRRIVQILLPPAHPHCACAVLYEEVKNEKV